MDWLAMEPVEDGLSVLAAYVTFCTVFVTCLMPYSLIAATYPQGRRVVIGITLTLSLAAFVFVLFTVHGWLNAYQLWYTTPRDARL